MSSVTYIELLKGNRSFRRLWLGQVVSELGTWFNFIAGLGLVRAVSGAAPEATVIVMLMRLVPFAVFAPLAGAIVDRWSRRSVMLGTDIARMFIALGFLFVRKPGDLWIAYACMGAGSVLGALFEAAKNAAMPNLTGERGLLAGNALMFSSRFLLMGVGAALGGAASARFGYGAAFIINSLSFLVSAYSIWLIPGNQMHQETNVSEAQTHGIVESTKRVWEDIREGLSYIVRQPLVGALVGFNILWALGGGANGLLFDRLGGVVFASAEGMQPDTSVSVLYTASGMGLFIGMAIARRVGAHVELHNVTAGFMGWTIIIYGVLFASIGLMPSLWLVALMIFLSHIVLSVEFAVHVTLLMNVIPDRLRGRVTITDRATEILMMGLSLTVAGWSLRVITPRVLTIIAGLLSMSPGVVWLILFARGSLKLPDPAEPGPAEAAGNAERVELASAS